MTLKRNFRQLPTWRAMHNDRHSKLNWEDNRCTPWSFPNILQSHKLFSLDWLSYETKETPFSNKWAISSHFNPAMKVTAIWRFISVQLLGNDLFLVTSKACGLFSISSTFNALNQSSFTWFTISERSLFPSFPFPNTSVLL